MPEKTYRAGLIGLGFIGGGDQVSGDRIGQVVSNLDGNHRETLMKSPRVELVAGCSRNEGQRERFAERTGAKTYSDWREMIEQESLDLLNIAVYSPANPEIVIPCARRVKAIYCEKPVSTNVADAERMLSACEDSGTLLAINHNRRFNPNYLRLRDAIADGLLGELTSINLQWSNGRLGNVATHFFDALRLVTGREIEAVSGILDPARKPDCRGPQFEDPGGWGMLRLEGGLVVTVDAADYARVPVGFVINGTEGRALTGGADVKIEFWDGRSEHWPKPEDGFTSMDRTLAAIISTLDGTAPFPYAASGAVRALEAIVAFHISHDKDAAWVSLPLTGADRQREVHSA